MVKLAPMLEEIPEDICVSGHERSGSHDRKLHQAFPLSRGGGIGPESITLKSEMANHNSRVVKMPEVLLRDGTQGQREIGRCKVMAGFRPHVIRRDSPLTLQQVLA